LDHRGFRDRLVVWGSQAPRGLLGNPVRTGTQGHRVLRALLGLVVNQALTATLERMAHQDRLALQGSRVQLDLQEHLDFKGLLETTEHQARRDSQAPRVPQELPAPQVNQGLTVSPVPRALMALLGLRVSPVPQGH